MVKGSKGSLGIRCAFNVDEGGECQRRGIARCDLCPTSGLGGRGGCGWRTVKRRQGLVDCGGESVLFFRYDMQPCGWAHRSGAVTGSGGDVGLSTGAIGGAAWG
ncbi:hypothetical protein Tco_1508053 [Tanacetum coccineum]|uniref:Uncharacterized protein n=1 Tax=Tanacetum coccineum TaxID=301880 RepID=A0ABQ5IL47_9ASTR